MFRRQSGVYGNANNPCKDAVALRFETDFRWRGLGKRHQIAPFVVEAKVQGEVHPRKGRGILVIVEDLDKH